LAERHKIVETLEHDVLLRKVTAVSGVLKPIPRYRLFRIPGFTTLNVGEPSSPLRNKSSYGDRGSGGNGTARDWRRAVGASWRNQPRKFCEAPGRTVSRDAGRDGCCACAWTDTAADNSNNREKVVFILVQFNGTPHPVQMWIKPGREHEGAPALVMFIEGEAIDSSVISADQRGEAMTRCAS
jgi:hypothetical protein